MVKRIAFLSVLTFASLGHAAVNRAIEMADCSTDTIVVRVQNGDAIERREFGMYEGHLSSITFRVEGSKDSLRREFMKPGPDGKPTYFLHFVPDGQVNRYAALFEEFERYRAVCVEHARQSCWPKFVPFGIEHLSLPSSFYWY